jgi:hypothetical protein
VCDTCPADNTDNCNTQYSASQVINSSGGNLTNSANETTITIPAGALSNATSISMTRTGSNFMVYGGSANYRYALGPEGTNFSSPVTITFKYTCGRTCPTTKVYYYNTTTLAWDLTNAVCSAGTCTLQTTHFSDYALVTFAEPSAAPSKGLQYGEVDGGGGYYGCTENWICSEWSSCENKIQTRTCTDSGNCGTAISKPSETQSCGLPAPEIISISAEELAGAAEITITSLTHIDFIVIENGTEVSHTIIVSEINEETKEIFLIIYSEPLYLKLSEGESRKIDVNNDGIYDVEITLKQIVDGKADIEIKKVAIERPALLPVPFEVYVIMTVILITAWLVLIIALISSFAKKAGRKKHRK